MRRLLLSIILLVSIPTVAFAGFFESNYTDLGKTMRYVCDTAVCGQTPGAGTDWTNAYDDLPATLTRDYVYFVADGDYGGHTFSDADSGTDYIYIVKATASDHGTDTGWNSSYGDGQAVFAGTSHPTFRVNRSYYTIDGQTGSGSAYASYGFKFTTTYCPVGQSDLLSFDDNGQDNSYFRIAHVDFSHCGSSYADGATHSAVRASADMGGSYTWSNIHFAYCSFRGVSQDHMTFVGYYGSSDIRMFHDVTIEYSYFYDRNNTYNNPHGQCIQILSTNSATATGLDPQHNFIIRYNTFVDNYVTAIVALTGSNSVGPPYHNHSYVQFYGNLVYRTGDCSNCILSNGVVAATSGGRAYNIDVYNNTVADYSSSSNNCGTDYKVGGSDNNTYNNMFYNCYIGFGGHSFSNATHDYNAWSTLPTSSAKTTAIAAESYAQTAVASTIFADYLDDDFVLVSATDNGSALSSPYNQDCLQTWGSSCYTRGADGVWDMGAYEYKQTHRIGTLSGAGSFQ